MARAIWNGIVIADSDNTEVVEGNHYFPPESVNTEYFKESPTRTTCPWKGLASYYTLEADGVELSDGAWYYPTPKSAAKNIENYVAFYRAKGITVES